MTKSKNEMIVPEPPQQTLTAVANWTAVRNLAEAVTLAELVVASAAIPDVKNKGQAVLKILAGAEMGFGPFASLVDVHIIEGKPAIGAKLMAASIKRSGIYDYHVSRLDSQVCALEFFRHGKTLGMVSYTLEEATRAGVATGRDGKLKASWLRHPDDMLFARCVSKGFRRHCPDLCGGVATYDPDELDSAPPQPEPAKAQQPQTQDAEVVAVSKPPAASANQVKRLKELVKELGFSEQQQTMALKARSVTRFEDLSSMRAGEMLAGLEERLRLEKAKAEQAAAEIETQEEMAAAG